MVVFALVVCLGGLSLMLSVGIESKCNCAGIFGRGSSHPVKIFALAPIACTDRMHRSHRNENTIYKTVLNS